MGDRIMAQGAVHSLQSWEQISTRGQQSTDLKHPEMIALRIFTVRRAGQKFFSKKNTENTHTHTLCAGDSKGSQPASAWDQTPAHLKRCTPVHQAVKVSYRNARGTSQEWTVRPACGGLLGPFLLGSFTGALRICGARATPSTSFSQHRRSSGRCEGRWVILCPIVPLSERRVPGSDASARFGPGTDRGFVSAMKPLIRGLLRVCSTTTEDLDVGLWPTGRHFVRRRTFLLA